jgi:hypothetical protein
LKLQIFNFKLNYTEGSLFFSRRNQTNVNLPIFSLNWIRFYRKIITRQTRTAFQRKRFFVERTRHFWLIALRPNHAARQCHLLFVRTLILRRKPFVEARKLINRNLLPVDQSANAAIFRHIRGFANRNPRRRRHI